MALLSWLCYLTAILPLLLTGHQQKFASGVQQESANETETHLPTMGNITHSQHHHAGNETKQCIDGKNNYVVAESSYDAPKEVTISNLSGLLYYQDGIRPACHDGRASVLLPGIVEFLNGTLHVPADSKYNLIESGIMRMTVRSPAFADPLCLRGKSQYLILPNMFCSFNLCELIGMELCYFLQKPGVHTIKELEEKFGFNSTVVLPEPPSLLGVSLLDLFSGEFWFRFSLETEGRIILEVDIPSNDKYLQLGLYPDDDGNDK